MAKFVIGTVLCLALFVLGIQANDEPKPCEGADMPKWFLPFGEKHHDQVDQPSNQKYQICQPFTAFGHASNIEGFRVSIRKEKAAGSIRVYPKAGYNTPGSFEIRASRAGYEESSQGVVSSRVSELPSDLDKVARIINEGYPCLERGNFTPNAVIVATYTCMKHEGERDTFQVLLATNAVKMYVILNYFMLHTGNGLQFAIIDRMTKAKHPLIADLRKNQLAEELLTSSNGVKTGTWVFDVTGNAPSRPEACPKTPDECTMTRYGSVNTYDGAFNRVPANLRRTVSRSLFAHNDSCNFMARVRMDVHGRLRYVEFYAGTYTDNDMETMTNFALERKEGLVQRRGRDLRRAELVAMPFSWFENDQKVVTITKTGGNYLVESEMCDYRMEYRPNGPEPYFRLRVSEDYEDEVDGLCDNYDRLLSDDD